jgi:ribosomal protein S18 acetylase RimI-like enzyme
MIETPQDIVVRPTRPEDFDNVIALTRQVYPTTPPWTHAQLASHLSVFPEGQLVAVAGDRVVGMAASLIVYWDDYDFGTSWRDFTGSGTFSNHDPKRGRTLYAAEVMVAPDLQGRGVGGRLYAARRDLVTRLELRRIRSGARLRGYHRFADQMTADEYVAAIVAGKVRDATLSFQLRHGFTVLGVVDHYLRHDPESLGHAAVIEWLNPQQPQPE